MFRDQILWLCAALLFVVTPAIAQSNGERFTKANGFSLGDGTLLEVQNKFGPSRLIATGDAGDYEESVCYRTQGGYFYFLAGEMSAGDHGLIGFGASKKDRSVPCSVPAKAAQSLRLEIAGLKLGITREQFKTVVGVPVQWDKDVGLAFYTSKRLMTDTEISSLPEDIRKAVAEGKEQNYYDVSISVKATFSRGLLESYKVWKIESL